MYMEIDKTVCSEGYVSRQREKLLLGKAMTVERCNSHCCRMLHHSRGQNSF